MISFTLQLFETCPLIDAVVVVASAANFKNIRALSSKFPKVRKVVPGGETRFDSSRIGFLQAQKLGADMVIFHNACNPGATATEVNDVINAAEKNGAAGVAHKVYSTLRREKGGVVDREHLFAMETPQAIKTDIFLQGLEQLTELPTDDLGVAEAAGIIPTLLPADPANRKITVAADLDFFAKIFAAAPVPRIGIGQDSHRFSSSGTLILGGMEFANAPRLVANSDGDAVLHAVTNAICSAIGEGSLSAFADPLCKAGITDSAAYLAVALTNMRRKSGTIGNISIAIEALRPKLEQSFPAMQQKIAALCGVIADQVGITVTSGEQLTDVGKGKGIAVFATVTVVFSGEQ